MASTDVVPHEAQELALRSVPVPSFLQDLGVKFAYDEASNARLVLIPRTVSEKVNVIDPVTSLVQADPNWTPRISIAELNPSGDGPHFYKQAGGKLAPTKQALEVLGKAAGILYTKTRRIPRSELDEGEIGYTATLGVRRSDGTVEEISREKVWNEKVERNDIEAAVGRSDKTGAAAAAEIEKRWLKELQDRYAKTESKAVLRAIRSSLQIPHTFSPADAAKPFLVIGFNFTPDYNDAEVKRALVAAGLNASEALYGSRELPSGDGSDLTHATVDTQQASPPLSPPVGGEAPGNPDAEPAESETGQSGYNLPQRALEELAAKAANFVPPKGVHADAGRTLQQILELGNDGRKWFGAALRAPSDNESYTDALWAFARVHLPELAAAVEAEKETQL